MVFPMMNPAQTLFFIGFFHFFPVFGGTLLTGQWLATKGPQGVKPVPAAVSLGHFTIGGSKSNLRPGP